jgi:hypothetical protein
MNLSLLFWRADLGLRVQWTGRSEQMRFATESTERRSGAELQAESSRRKLAVLRRCPTPLTMMIAALACGFGWWPSVTQAASSSSSTPGVQTYSWITSVNIPPLATNSPPQIQFLVEPNGSLTYVPPTSTSTGTSPLAGPLSVTPSLDSSNQAKVGVLNATINGQPVELLGFSFSNGLQSGSILQASLKYNTSQPPTIIPETSGVSGYTPPSPSANGSGGSQNSSGGSQNGSGGSQNGSGGSQNNGGGGGVTPDAQTPEPLSLLIWAALAGGVIARVRLQRSSRSVALARIRPESLNA